jgi:hypothetical protein
MKETTYLGGCCGKSSSLILIHFRASVRHGSSPASASPVSFAWETVELCQFDIAARGGNKKSWQKVWIY